MALRPMGLSGAASNLVNSYMMGKQFKAQQEEKDKQDQIRSLMGNMLMGGGTEDQTRQLAELAPDKFLGVQDYLQGVQAQEAEAAQVLNQERDINDLTQMLVLDEAGQNEILQNRIMEVEAADGDSSGSRFLLGLDPEQRNQYLKMQAGKYNIVLPEGDTFQQGTGDMSGHVFNQTQGTYSIDPEVKAQLEADAAELAKSDDILKGKDLAGVNDKVTGLVKGTQDIVASAESLEALMGHGSPAAQIAAVFKFMKANDPTSTVRESELGLVYEAEGSMKAFGAMLNKMLGEGGLSESNFADLVDTAKVIANSATASTADSVNSYLSVLEDSLSAKDFNSLRNRVPQALQIEEAITEADEAPQSIVVDEAMSEVDSIMQELGY